MKCVCKTQHNIKKKTKNKTMFRSAQVRSGELLKRLEEKKEDK